ncbi:MAG: hypothetical protein KDI05_05205 [Halieaceae bacterium]|nr:hypothetical protein [Halieaceae bacterium]MCP5163836.1 hypothetical protein [Pseudomonadales bacterium]MCP5202886.1 hypothetical protein [Pseudomonadales bacterium]
MQSLCWIVVGSLAMCAIALVGSVTLFLSEETMQKLLLPLVSIAAGSMLGGAFFHMIPAGIEHTGSTLSLYVWIALGFSTFFCPGTVPPLATLPPRTNSLQEALPT